MAGVFSAKAQDVITLKSGEEIKVKVTEISATEIKYKQFENLDGPTIVIEKAKVFAINYENGTREIINVITENTGKEQQQKATGDYNLDPNKFHLGIYANPIGFLTFGPMVGVEFTIKKFIGEINVRFPSLGLMMPLLGEANSMGSCIGTGVGLKYFKPYPKGGLYVGGYVEYFKHEYNYNQGTGKEQGTAVAANIGYKFTFKSGLYIRTGAYLGVGATSECITVRGEKEPGDVAFFGQVDVAIGFNFFK